MRINYAFHEHFQKTRRYEQLADRWLNVSRSSNQPIRSWVISRRMSSPFRDLNVRRTRFKKKEGQISG